MNSNNLNFQNLSGKTKIRHLISTRNGGNSSGNFDSLNLSLKVGDDEKLVQQNRKLFARNIKVDPSSLLFPEQCHTANCRLVDADTSISDLVETDALITQEKNICLAVLSADCVPILLFDPVRQVIAAIHAGWKGTVNEIARKTVLEMNAKFGCSGQNILAAIGPSISWQNYEVGEEVAAAFKIRFGNNPEIIHFNTSTGKAHIDLWEANRKILLDTGLVDPNIEISRICTFGNPELFFSARRDGFQCGRFGVGIMLV